MCFTTPVNDEEMFKPCAPLSCVCSWVCVLFLISAKSLDLKHLVGLLQDIKILLHHSWLYLFMYLRQWIYIFIMKCIICALMQGVSMGCNLSKGWTNQHHPIWSHHSWWSRLAECRLTVKISMNYKWDATSHYTTAIVTFNEENQVASASKINLLLSLWLTELIGWTARGRQLCFVNVYQK